MKTFVAALLATAVMGQTTADSCAALKTAWDNAATADKTTAKAAYDTCVTNAQSAQKLLCDGFAAAKSASGATQQAIDAANASAKAAGCSGANALAGSLAAVALAIYATTF